MRTVVLLPKVLSNYIMESKVSRTGAFVLGTQRPLLFFKT